jgi:hypothetical protein
LLLLLVLVLLVLLLLLLLLVRLKSEMFRTCDVQLARRLSEGRRCRSMAVWHVLTCSCKRAMLCEWS